MTAISLEPGLMLVHGNHPEALRDLLVTWVQRYPLAPLENEIILVQSNGIAQWLKLALAADPDPGGGGGCGIAAALDISLPSRFLWRVYRTVLGPAAVPENSPFDKSRLIWRLMRLLPDLLDQPDYAPLRQFLEQDADRRKRFQLAERLADLFDQYQVYRAGWLEAWGRDERVLIKANGERTPLPAGQGWQPALWQALLADVERTLPAPERIGRGGRAAVHAAFLRHAQTRPEGDRPAGLPRRVVVFGIASLPRQSLEVLAMLGRWTQVLACVPNPCEYYWGDCVADRELLRAEYRRQPRRQGSPKVLTEAELHLHAHPLLAAWGKQGRDFIELLNEYDSPAAQAAYQPHFSAIGHRIDLFTSQPPETLLRQLQDDIRRLRPVDEARATWSPVDPATDGSLRFHPAHSPQREVEILHDRLLAAFNADPSLRPRDVIVMVPDIDVYAPHIQAVFGLLDREDPRYLPFTVADQVQRQVDPLLQALEQLLALPQSRLTVSDVLSLLEVPALRQRFGIAEDDLPQLHRWMRGANIRWGLHDAQRASLGLPAQAGQPEASTQAVQNTWLFGLRRMLLGYAVGAQMDAWRSIDPYDEIGGLEAALLGPLVRLLDTLESVWNRLREPATVSAWGERLRALLADCFAATESRDAYTLRQLELALQEWQEACSEAALTEMLPLSVVGPYWLSRLEDHGLSQRFFGGAVTFATLMPMRAIPFRRIALLGMNDGEYPRSRAPLDFDLMGQDYQPGDRSRREDDRYLFLEALLSARDSLHISWVGRSITDNSPRPPSVLVGQLRDHLRAVWRLADRPGPNAGQALLDRLTCEHPLQPFSPAYFPATHEPDGLLTYAHEWQPATRPVRVAPPEPLVLLARDEPLTVRHLAEFLKAPVKAFFRERLKVYFEVDHPVSADQEPFALDALETWQLQDELIQAQADALARGGVLNEALAAQLARIARRGALATGGFGAAMATDLAAPMADLFTNYQAALERWPIAVAEEELLVHATDHAGQTLELADWLGGVRCNAAGERGRVVLESSHLVDRQNRYRREKLIGHWVRHLAQHRAGGPLTSVIISKKGQVTFPPLTQDEAVTQLNRLLIAWQQGMRQPLPLAARTAFAWLQTGSLQHAQAAYEGRLQNSGEVQGDAYLQRAYPDFAALSASGEFIQLAERLLRPLDAVLNAGGGP